ncbi:hypothetical protein [Methanoplanus endosymbiosus]|uniref:Uncharacterized protein n=1 Tax=Methanoplanus endosymbiosus TaxID=33865 RepID=A0A9E7PPW4_9EURY|nr:hypothetical protein [Methanoplanus endosymbiosus]UUX92874.1 hypothetical protein L6E24_01730 [Methanoplanus endosymbiosus]
MVIELNILTTPHKNPGNRLISGDLRGEELKLKKRINLSAKGFEGIIDDLNQILFMDVAESDGDLGETEKQLIEAWSGVESGSINTGDAEYLLSVEKNPEKSFDEDN